MESWVIALIIIGVIAFIALNILVMYFYTNNIAKRLFKLQWVRDYPNKYPRACSDKNFDYHLDMFNKGMLFRKENIDKVHELSIKSGGLKLHAEYYDFGYDRTIIILPGRMETAHYSAYYVSPLKDAGYNALCVDQRAHGLSEGERITLGLKESYDALNWAEYLNRELGQKTIGIFGICFGSSAAAYALHNNHPDYIKFAIFDSMFYSFYEMYKRHIKDEKKPVFPVIFEVLHLIKKHNNVSPYKASPYRLVPSIKEPVLFIGGCKDIFAPYSDQEKLYELSTSSHKEIVKIENGRHSHLRYDGLETYDNAIINFLKNIEN